MHDFFSSYGELVTKIWEWTLVIYYGNPQPYLLVGHTMMIYCKGKAITRTEIRILKLHSFKIID